MKIKFKSKVLFVVVIILSLAILITGCGGTQSSEPKENKSEQITENEVVSKFPEKDVFFIVPYAPGGGYDIIARLISPVMEKYLPNKVNIVVKNTVGGDAVKGMTEIWSAEKDGYTIGMMNLPGTVPNQILGRANYDLSKFTWIGRVSSEPSIACFSPKSPYRTLEDLQKAQEVKVGVSGLNSTVTMGLAIIGKEIGVNFKFVPHSGFPEAYLAAIRGDVDMVFSSFGALKGYIVDSKQLIPFVVFSDERLNQLPDTPTIKEMGYQQYINLFTMNFLIASTPEIPDDVAQIWRDAFNKAVNDPEFINAMDKASREIAIMDGEESKKMAENYVKLYSEYKDLLAQFYK